MEEVFLQNQIAAMDKAGNVVLDIEGLTQPSDKCSGSPKMTKALSRKGSSRMEKRNGEEQEADETSKKLVIKVGCSQLDQLKQPAMPIKVLIAPPTSVNISGFADTGDGRSRRFHRLTTINPKKILLLFASMNFSDHCILFRGCLMTLVEPVVPQSEEPAMGMPMGQQEQKCCSSVS